jgi:hypothetical protein
MVNASGMAIPISAFVEHHILVETAKVLLDKMLVLQD